MLIERRKCKREGRSFPAFVAEHQPEIERGIEHYLAQDTDEGRYLAASLREIVREAKK